MRSKRFRFPGSQGVELSARLDKPDQAPRAYALFAHCFTCTKDIFAASRIAEGLSRRGIAVLRFDFTGLGSSAGEFANTNFSSNVDDLVAAADHMRDTLAPPALLIGHSLGGAAVVAAAHRMPEARAVATIGAPHDPAHVIAHFADRLAEITERGAAEVHLVGRPFTIKKQFIDDIRAASLDQHLAGLRRSLLVMHSPIDQVVGIENAQRLFQAAKHPKSYLSLDRADHLLSRRADADYVAGVLAAWADNSLDPPPEPAAAAPAAADDAQVVVEETLTGRFQQSVRIGRHHLTADEPVAVGGDDAGPGPYDLLLAGLGACTAMTVRMYAQHKGWPLERVRVALTHEKIHAKDCAECETREGRIDRIQRTVTLDGEALTAEQRARLVEIADKCPVHRTLHAEVVIDTVQGQGALPPDTPHQG